MVWRRTAHSLSFHRLVGDRDLAVRAADCGVRGAGFLCHIRPVRHSWSAGCPSRDLRGRPPGLGESGASGIAPLARASAQRTLADRWWRSPVSRNRVQLCGGGVFWTAGPATFLRTAGVGEPAPTIQAPVGRTLTPVRSPRQHREEENVRDGTTRRAPMGVRKEGAQMVMPMPAEWSFGTTIPAKDLDGTRRFYEGVLGAQVVMEDPGGIIYRSGDSSSASTPPSSPGRPSTPWAPSWSRMSRRRWPISEARA